MAYERQPGKTDPEPSGFVGREVTAVHKIGLIALDLDGTLLDSQKNLSGKNLTALNRAADMGIEIVPTTGRYYMGMPELIRDLPFIRYAITINGAEVLDTKTGQVIYRAEMPWTQAVEIMTLLDDKPVIYDCFMDGTGWMTREFKGRIDTMVEDPHFVKLLKELRQGVPELKAFLTQRRQDVQKIQFFTRDMELRSRMLEELPRLFPGIVASSSGVQNVEINHKDGNKGSAVLALAKHLGLPREATMAIGDGLNDLSMIRMAGVGVAMENAIPQILQAADHITACNDDHGVALAIERFCF